MHSTEKCTFTVHPEICKMDAPENTRTSTIHLDNTVGCLVPGRDTAKHVHPLVNKVLHNVHPYIKISEMVFVCR